MEDHLRDARHAFQDLIIAASGADFDAADASAPQEVGGQWFWTAWQDIIPLFSLSELESLLNPLIETHPEAHQLLCVRGLAYCWEEAQADLSAALDRVPEGTLLWHSYAYPLAILHVHLGHLDRHRALVEKAVRHMKGAPEASLAERVAKMCLLSAQTEAFHEEATGLAYVAMGSLPDSLFAWYSLTVGMAECRRGNWQLAIEVLDQARAPAGFENPSRMATSFVFQALAYEKLAQHEEAQKSLTAAEEITKSRVSWTMARSSTLTERKSAGSTLPRVVRTRTNCSRCGTSTATLKGGWVFTS